MNTTLLAQASPSLALDNSISGPNPEGMPCVWIFHLVLATMGWMEGGREREKDDHNDLGARGICRQIKWRQRAVLKAKMVPSKRGERERVDRRKRGWPRRKGGTEHTGKATERSEGELQREGEGKEEACRCATLRQHGQRLSSDSAGHEIPCRPGCPGGHTPASTTPLPM